MHENRRWALAEDVLGYLAAAGSPTRVVDASRWLRSTLYGLPVGSAVRGQYLHELHEHLPVGL